VNPFIYYMKTVTILAIFAILAGASTLATTGSTIVTSAIAQMTDNATMGNMTAGNMTMGAGNMTADNATGSISRHS
jgi:hypothetical protein